MGALVEKKEYPGEELMIRPLPKKLLDIAASSLKEEIKEYDGKFTPESEVNSEIITGVISTLSDFAFDKLHFRDWEYEISYIPNVEIENITFEIMAKKLNFKPKICVLSKMYDFQNKFNLYKGDLSWTSAREFMLDLEVELKETNRNIMKWNEICKRHKPIIYAEPPTDTLFEIFGKTLWDTLWEKANNYWGLYQQEGLDAIPLTAYDLFCTLDYCTPIPFGEDNEWQLDTTFTGNDDCVLLQIWVRHRKFKEIAFVLEEVEGDFYDQMLASQAMDFVNYILDKARMAATQWNVLLTEDEIRGGVIDERPINFNEHK